MTGNTRQGIGLLVVAALTALLGLLGQLASADLGGLLLLLAGLVAVIGLVKIAYDFLRPQPGD